MADYVHAAQRSLTHNRGLRRSSPIMCIKSLRSWAKQCSWQKLLESTAQPIGKRVLLSHSHPRRKRICAHFYGSTHAGSRWLAATVRLFWHSIALALQHQVRRYTANAMVQTQHRRSTWHLHCHQVLWSEMRERCPCVPQDVPRCCCMELREDERVLAGIDAMLEAHVLPGDFCGGLQRSCAPSLCMNC